MNQLRYLNRTYSFTETLIIQFIARHNLQREITLQYV